MECPRCGEFTQPICMVGDDEHIQEEHYCNNCHTTIILIYKTEEPKLKEPEVPF